MCVGRIINDERSQVAVVRLICGYPLGKLLLPCPGYALYIRGIVAGGKTE